MHKDIDIGDAVAILWTNAPDAMEVLMEELTIQREERFDAVRDAKQNGVDPDWLMGEMLAYQEMQVNLSKPESISSKVL